MVTGTEDKRILLQHSLDRTIHGSIKLMDVLKLKKICPEDENLSISSKCRQFFQKIELEDHLKIRILHTWKNYPGKELRVMMGSKLNRNSQSTTKVTNTYLKFIKKSQ